MNGGMENGQESGSGGIYKCRDRQTGYKDVFFRICLDKVCGSGIAYGHIHYQPYEVKGSYGKRRYSAAQAIFQYQGAEPRGRPAVQGGGFLRNLQ